MLLLDDTFVKGFESLASSYRLAYIKVLWKGVDKACRDEKGSCRCLLHQQYRDCTKCVICVLCAAKKIDFKRSGDVKIENSIAPVCDVALLGPVLR